MRSFDKWYTENGYYHDTVTDRKELMREAWNAASSIERETGYPRIEAILELFMEADTAFAHGDDITHMLKFGEATDMMKYYFHLKSGGKPGEPPVAAIDEQGRRG